MSGRKQEINLQLQQIVDGILLLATFWGSFALRYYGTYWFGWDVSIAPFTEFHWMIPLIMPFGVIALEMQGFYNSPHQKTIQKSLGQMARAAFWFCLLVAGCVIFFKLQVPSRAVVILFAVSSTVVLLIRERITVLSYRRNAQLGRFVEHVMLAGIPSDMEQFRESLTPDQLIEMKVVAEFNIEIEPVGSLIDALHRHSVSRVIFAGAHSHLNRLQEAITACETEGVEAWLEANFIKTSIARPSFDTFGTKPMLVFRATPAFSWEVLTKEVLDRVMALVLIVLSSPIMLAAALAIKITSPGPMIFRQERGGKNGKPFTMFKFRTMHTDAEMQRQALESLNQMSGPVFKIENDPRVTWIGRILRKTSIDELPQLINVVLGDMSLVGPRPHATSHNSEYEKLIANYAFRHHVKPGLTGWAQVNGARGETSNIEQMERRVEYDLWYINNWSPWLDLRIVLQTVVTALRQTSAY